jgi:hypothetical protein
MVTAAAEDTLPSRSDRDGLFDNPAETSWIPKPSPSHPYDRAKAHNKRFITIRICRRLAFFPQTTNVTARLNTHSKSCNTCNARTAESKGTSLNVRSRGGHVPKRHRKHGGLRERTQSDTIPSASWWACAEASQKAWWAARAHSKRHHPFGVVVGMSLSVSGVVLCIFVFV